MNITRNSIIPALISIAITASCAAISPSCRRGAPDIDAAGVYLLTEEAVRKQYIFSGDSVNEVVKRSYSAAMKGLTPGGEGDSPGSQDRIVRMIENADDSKKREMLYGSLRAFLRALPGGNNGFVSPEGIKWVRDPERNAGVGLVINEEDRGKFLVIDTLEGSASNRERMEIGGYIHAVDGVDAGNMDLNELVGRIKGPSGSKVSILYNDREVTLVRGEFAFQNILHSQWYSGDDRVLYITLRSSLPGTADQLAALISAQDRLHGVVVDLRRLQQGSLDESFRLADLFLGKGEMGTLVKTGGKRTPYPSDPDVIFTGPVVLIANRYTSLYGQAVLMALKESRKIRTVSSSFTPTTFISEIIPVPSGIELFLTTGYLLDPQGDPFHTKKFMPDREVAEMLPANPPLPEPDKTDPAQMAAAELMRSMGR